MMTVDTMAPADGSPPEVMASVESSSRRSTLIIADISCDDAWVSMGASEAPTLAEWR